MRVCVVRALLCLRESLNTMITRHHTKTLSSNPALIPHGSRNDVCIIQLTSVVDLRADTDSQLQETLTTHPDTVPA